MFTICQLKYIPTHHAIIIIHFEKLSILVQYEIVNNRKKWVWLDKLIIVCIYLIVVYYHFAWIQVFSINPTMFYCLSTMNYYAVNWLYTIDSPLLWSQLKLKVFAYFNTDTYFHCKHYFNHHPSKCLTWPQNFYLPVKYMYVPQTNNKNKQNFEKLECVYLPFWPCIATHGVSRW